MQSVKAPGPLVFVAVERQAVLASISKVESDMQKEIGEAVEVSDKEAESGSEGD